MVTIFFYAYTKKLRLSFENPKIYANLYLFKSLSTIGLDTHYT